MRACTATRHEEDLREMVAAHWSNVKIGGVLGVSRDTVALALRQLGIRRTRNGTRVWSDRKYKTAPIIAQIRTERMVQDLSVRELAEKTGWSHRLYQEWEHGGRRMHVQALVDVAQALGYEIVLKRIES